MHLTPYLKAGVARVRRALHLRQGLCVILGGVGLGKSSLLRLVASNYETDQNCSACYLHDSRKCKTPFDLLKIMSEDFHVPAKRSQLAHINELEGFFLDNYQC